MKNKLVRCLTGILLLGTLHAVPSLADISSCLRNAFNTQEEKGTEGWKIAAIACSGGTPADNVSSCLRSAFNTQDERGTEGWKIAAIACSGGTANVSSCLRNAFNTQGARGTEGWKIAAIACSGEARLKE